MGVSVGLPPEPVEGGIPEVGHPCQLERGFSRAPIFLRELVDLVCALCALAAITRSSCNHW